MWGEGNGQTQADLGQEIHLDKWKSRRSLPFELASFRFVLPIARSPAAASF
jgi:hypothetical protein